MFYTRPGPNRTDLSGRIEEPLSTSGGATRSEEAPPRLDRGGNAAGIAG